ncbi:MAG TPA: hypothetical protein VD963_02440 [Phycisphaerales bacterium]|nr:hypothetical protein [Phycisphaerales bacterium]
MRAGPNVVREVTVRGTKRSIGRSESIIVIRPAGGRGGESRVPVSLRVVSDLIAAPRAITLCDPAADSPVPQRITFTPRPGGVMPPKVTARIFPAHPGIALARRGGDDAAKEGIMELTIDPAALGPAGRSAVQLLDDGNHLVAEVPIAWFFESRLGGTAPSLSPAAEPARVPSSPR